MYPRKYFTLNLLSTKYFLAKISKLWYIHTYIHTIHTYIRTYIHTYIHIYIQTYIHTYIHTYIQTHTQTHRQTHIQTYRHTYTNTYIHTRGVPIIGLAKISATDIANSLISVIGRFTSNIPILARAQLLLF